MGIDLKKYGFMVNDIVEVKRQWCVVCAKARVHEFYAEWSLCLVCNNLTNQEEETAKSQMAHFLRGEENEPNKKHCIEECFT